MSRCTLQIVLLFAALTCALDGTAAAQQACTDDDAWPLAVRIRSYGDYPETAWTHLPKIGVKYLFLPVPAPDQVDATLAKLKAHGLIPLVLRGDADLSKDAFAAEIGKQLAVCEKMGVKYMFLSAKRGETPKAEAYTRLRAAGEAAEKHGVIIGLETHPDLGTNGAVQCETMRAVNHPNIRVNFDTANITYYNKNTTAAAELAKSIDYVGTVEFKDHSCEFETWIFPPVGQGKVDFPAIIRLLREHHYQGPVTIEFEGTKGVALSEDQAKLAIAESVARVRSLGNFK